MEENKLVRRGRYPITLFIDTRNKMKITKLLFHMDPGANILWDNDDKTVIPIAE